MKVKAREGRQGKVKGRKGKGRKGLLFVNKKKQKNFVTLGRAGFSATVPEASRFFKKASAKINLL